MRQGTIPDSFSSFALGMFVSSGDLTEKECGMDTAEKAMYPRLADVTMDLGIRGTSSVRRQRHEKMA